MTLLDDVSLVSSVYP